MAGLADDVRALLAAPNFAHLATVLPDGAPHVVPVWVGLEGDRIAFFTQPGSRKARNLEREPRVALSLTDFENPYASVWIRGRVVETVEGEPAFEIIDRIAVKYTGRPFPMRTGVVYLVQPDRAAYVQLPFAHTPPAGT
jgi:PPOX class probable F420-dependent enzyme